MHSQRRWFSVLLVIPLLALSGCSLLSSSPAAPATPQTGTPDISLTGRWQVLALSSFAIQTRFNLTVDLETGFCNNYKCELKGHAELSAALSAPPNPDATGTYFYRDGFAIYSVEFNAPSIGPKKYQIYIDIGANSDEFQGYYLEWDSRSGDLLRSAQIKMTRLS